MSGSFLEQTRIPARRGQLIQEMLLFFQNGEIEFVALAIVEALDDIALLAGYLEARKSLRDSGSGFAKLLRALVAAGLKHHARVLVLEHFAGGEIVFHGAATSGQLFDELGVGFKERVFGVEAGAKFARVIFERLAGGAFAHRLHGGQ
jgi:hypothetical protein